MSPAGKSALILFGVAVLAWSEGWAASVLDENVTIDGHVVRSQKLTLDCDLLKKSKTGGFERVQETFTIHLLDKAAVPGGARVTQEMHGLYHWRTKEWTDLCEIDTNEIWLFCWDEVRFINKEGWINDTQHQTHRAWADIKVGVARSDLSLQWKAQVQCYYEMNTPKRLWRECKYGEERTLQALYGQVKGCNLVDYRTPPRRLGF